MNYPLDIICFDKEENGAIRAKPQAVDWFFFESLPFSLADPTSSFETADLY